MLTQTQFTITEAQKKQYRDEGFFILKNVIPQETLNVLNNQCDSLVKEQDDEMDRQGTDVLNLSRRNSRYFAFLPHKNRPELGEFIFSDMMAAICRATVGDTAYLFWEQFVVKGSDKKGAEFPWHQDSGYVDTVHRSYVNAWIALDDVSEENGTIYIIPFSKAGTRVKVEHKPIPGSNDRVGYFGSEKGYPVVFSAGSIAVFSSLSFHRSGPNNTKNMRRAYALQYSPEIIYEPDGSVKGFDMLFLKDGKRVR
ncbi:MAG: phytanoyl-CoA dioxygenase family protein [Ignavibacteriales bacterium]|nr:phytanoyl-CoA dioxygenase family protein [Ignavibacteriales bacterium]